MNYAISRLLIDPPMKMTDNQYLGCSQREIFPEQVDIERMSAAFANMGVSIGDPSARVAHPELRKDGATDSAANATLSDTSPFHIEDKTDHVIDAQNSKPVKLTSSGNVKKKRDVTVRAGATPGFRKVRGYAYDMSGHVHSSVERYLELSKQHVSCLKPVATPCLDDHMLDPKDDEIKGVLSGDLLKNMTESTICSSIQQS